MEIMEKKLSEIFQYNNKYRSKSLDSTLSLKCLRNYTIEGIQPFLEYLLLQRRVGLKATYGDYNVFIPELISKGDEDVDIVLMAISLRELIPDRVENRKHLDEILKTVEQIISLAISETNSLIVVTLLHKPLISEFGISNHQPDLIPIDFVVNKINNYINMMRLNNSDRLYCLDIDRLLQRTGSSGWDLKALYGKNAPWAKPMLTELANEVAKIGFALKGKNKKCLVLDCDNTLWGGILGEDGFDGIKMSADSYPGNAFHDFQKYVLDLHNRGVIITLCSKNNEEDVLEVLEKHPNCLIKKSHIARYKINWNNKADNILALANELNIGLDSFIFVDDSSAECELVSVGLPEVTVFQVPKTTYTFTSSFAENGYFDSLKVSPEDLIRNQLYQQEFNRKSEAQKFTDIGSFYASLEIRLKIHEAKKEELPRVAQLTQKTNQFNLTTKRYSLGEIEAMSMSDSAKIYVLYASDKFGDLGLTGVCLVKKETNGYEIDTLLMSCRVLGRNIELRFIQKIFELLHDTFGEVEIHAQYLKTKKNTQTKDFWSKVGLERISGKQENSEYKGTLTAKLFENSVDYIIVNEL